MFLFSGCTKNRKKVKFKLEAALLVTYSTICNSPPLAPGKHRAFVYSGDHRLSLADNSFCVAHTKLSFVLEQRLQNNLVLENLCPQTIKIFFFFPMPSEVLQRRNWAAQESTVGKRDWYTRTLWRIWWCALKWAMAHLGHFFIVHHRRRCHSDIIK